MGPARLGQPVDPVDRPEHDASAGRGGDGLQPFRDLDQIRKDLVDLKIAQSRRVLPLHKRGNRLYVAISGMSAKSFSHSRSMRSVSSSDVPGGDA